MSESWPDITGIDTNEVRRLLQDDLELFVDVAVEFVDENSPELQSIDQILEGDDETARKRMHRLRGQASSIAAFELVAAIRVVEAILKGEQDGDRNAATQAVVDVFGSLESNIRAALC